MKDASTSGVRVSSHSCVNSGGRTSEGGGGEGVCGGKATSLSTKSIIEGSAEVTCAFICHTDQKFTLVLQVENASS